MAIDKTSRKEVIGLPSTTPNYVFTVPFEIENSADLIVYDKDGNLAVEGVNYSVSNHGLPGTTTNATTVTWIGSTAAGSYTFYRNAPRTQTLDLSAGFKNGEIEVAFDRLALASQNALQSSNNNYDAKSQRIQVVGDPINDTDAASVRYAQETYSKKGNICPGVNNVDNNKALYSQSTSSVIWKDPFDIPYPTAASKILQVDGKGEPQWVSPVEYAPVYPTSEPKYLSVGSSSKAWRAVNQLPTLTKGQVGHSLIYQFDDKVAWDYVRWLDNPPEQGWSLWNSTGTGAGGALGVETSNNISASKVCYLQKNSADTNNSGNWDFYCTSSTTTARVPIFEFDCSSYSANDYDYDTIISCNLRFFVKALQTNASLGNTTICLRRVKNPIVEDEATWNQSSDTTDWNWNDGVFDPTKELDNELPAPTFIIGGAAGADIADETATLVDITPLFLDAIRNRSGILRFAMFDPNPTSSSRWFRAYARGGNSDDVRIELKKSTARKAYWQPWNYFHSWNKDLASSSTEHNSPFTVQPHVYKGLTIANNQELKGTELGASQSVGFTYAVAHEIDAGDPNGDTYSQRGGICYTYYDPSLNESFGSIRAFWRFVDDDGFGWLVGNVRPRASTITLEYE
ncbi:MAG: hypothetical protein Unbinned4614contig1000_11 [Prokaryotic dsDNA virus sp.]|nr:MAG: hypothetical protein Unbinned4614contig1000_11 [Prokaryotic dsDNA virus sp.]|tara:strand:- start:382 stop:2262 length:1881 start_codon:yes stop_codon:yes gene_type:complete